MERIVQMMNKSIRIRFLTQGFIVRSPYRRIHKTKRPLSRKEKRAFNERENLLQSME